MPAAPPDPIEPGVRSLHLLRIDEDPDGVVRVAGDVDLSSARTLAARLRAARRPDEPLIVDLCAVKLLQSHGVAVLFDLATTVELHLRVTAGSAVASVIRVIGLDKVASVELVAAGG